MWQLYQHFRLEGRGIKDFEAFYEVYRDHNEKLWVRFRKGFIKREELRWKRMWHTLLDFKIGDTKIANELSAAYLEILPTQKFLVQDALEVVAYCATKYKLHIITNGFDEVQYFKLENTGLKNYFHTVTTAEAANALKPNIRIFEYALHAINAEAAQCMYIGDSPEVDGHGALNAGMQFVWLNTEGRENKFNFRQIADLGELITVL